MATKGQPNDRLRFERRRRGWTQTRTADEMAKKAMKLGLTVPTGLSGFYVSRWERGEVVPDYHSAHLLCLTFELPADRLGIPGATPQIDEHDRTELVVVSTSQNQPPSSVTIVPVKRRTFVKFGAALTGTAVLHPHALGNLVDALKDDPPDDQSSRLGLPALDVGKKVTTVDIEAVRELTVMFRRLDNRLGGGYGLTLLSHYMNQSVMEVIRRGSYDEKVGRDLFGAASQLAHLTAWMAYDMEQHDIARQHLERALELATAAGDSAFGGEILAALSHQAIYMRRASDALASARASQNAAIVTRNSALLAEGRVFEAHAHALTSDSKLAASALHRAETALQTADASSAPEWIRYMDEAYLAARFAHVFRELRQWPLAERCARRSLDMDQRFVRGRAFNTALLASTLVETDIEEACRVGTDAVELTAELQSSRSVNYINDLYYRLQPYCKERAVREFEERAANRLGSSEAD